MTQKEMQTKILTYIQKNGDASYANLFQHLGEDAKGEWSSELREGLVLWTGMSKMLLNSLRALKDQIEPVPTHVLVYLADGMTLNMPIARHARAYKKPHWLPVVFKLKKNIVKAATT